MNARRSSPPERSNGLEHLNYQRMLEDHDAELMQKPWHRRLWYPTVRMSQVAGAARLADHLLLLNERDRNFAMERHWKPPDDLSVVPHGVSSRFLETGFDPSHERGCGILFCGTWTGVKGIDYLADAFSWLVAEGERVRLTILGGGIPEDEIRRCFSAEAQTFLIILPRMVEELVIEQYRKHDILVFCSTYEGFGMVLLEAMSQGLPVISTPVGAAITLVRHGETGLSVPCRDADALAQAIRLLIQNAALRKRLAASAWQLVKGMTWEKTAKATLEVYQRKTACP